MTVRLLTLDDTVFSAANARNLVPLEILPLDALKSLKPEPGDMTYIDISSLGPDARRKAIQSLRRRSGDAAWGIIDPSAVIDDPAMVFFDGASDYIGPGAIEGGINKSRVKAVLAFAALQSALNAIVLSRGSENPSPPAPADEFPSWKSIVPGMVYPFYFLYVSVTGQSSLKVRLGEPGYAAFRDRLRAFIQQSFSDADILLWMEKETNSLYLLPPRASNIRSAIIACLRILVWTPLIGYEKFGLPFPVEFSFALHRGRSEFATPGKTGTIVSDALNFIFHLGTKRAEPGRITISAEAACDAVPEQFSDLFVDGGSYEGHGLVHTKRFCGRGVPAI
jgi:hypothetical protein